MTKKMNSLRYRVTEIRKFAQKAEIANLINWCDQALEYIDKYADTCHAKQVYADVDGFLKKWGY